MNRPNRNGADIKFLTLRMLLLTIFLTSVLSAQDTLIRWETPVNLSNDTVFNIHPWIEAQGNYVHAVWVEMDKRVLYRFSTDWGTTWSNVRQLNDTITSCILPKLYINNNYVHCIWIQRYLGADSRLHYRRSTNYGLTWDSVLTLWQYMGQDNGIAGCGDTIFVVGRCGIDTSLSFRKSTDNGITWLPRRVVNRHIPLYSEGLCYDCNSLHLSYTFLDSVYYTRSTDGGETWSIPADITEDPKASKCCHIAADSGYLFLPWLSCKYSGSIWNDVLLRRSTNNGLSWLPEQQITDHHLVDYDYDISAEYNDVYLIWDKISSGSEPRSIQFRASTNKGDTWWPIEDIFRCPSQSVLALAPSIAVSFPVLHVIWDHRRYDTFDIYYLRGTRLPVEVKDEKGSRLNHIYLTVFPNPFTNKTYIKSIPYSKIAIFDASGRIVKHLKGGETIWCGENDKGEILSPGVYFIIPDGGKKLVKKVVFLGR